jgi:hypothetical protein
VKQYRSPRLVTSMTYRFNDPRLEAIFARKQTNPATKPLEEAWERTTWRWIMSRHNFDLAVVAVLYIAAVLVAIVVIIGSGLMDNVDGFRTGLQIIFGTAVFGTFIELLRRTYDAAVKRLATIDLFTSEMLSIMRVFASSNIIGHFVRLYDELNVEGRTPPDAQTSPKEGSPSGFADVARKENYFSIFDKSSPDLASLDPAVVNDITAFYTFMKASRDATGAILLWKDVGYALSAKKEDVVNIVFLCFLMTMHGRIALERLTISEANRRIIDDIFAGVLLQCFFFLDHVVPKDDFRFPRIEQRRKECRELCSKHRYDFRLE